MANLEDVVIPILRSIQADIADLKRETRVLSERFDAFANYLTYLTGLTTRNQVDIKKLKEEMRALSGRVDVLEPQT